MKGSRLAINAVDQVAAFDRDQKAVAFFAEAITRADRVARYLEANARYRLPG